MMVKEIVMEKAYKKLGIDVTPEELFDLVQGNNLPPIIQQLFANPETGQVDKADVIRFLKYIQANPDAPQKEYWVNVEKQIVATAKETKYQTLVGKALYATSLQAKLSLEEKNKDASLQFIQKKFIDVPDDQVKISDKELKDYYNKNISQYKQDAQRTITYVTFEIRPSEEDDQETLRAITELKDDFMRATENSRFVNANADSRFEDVYQTESELVPHLSAWAFSAETGDVYGPYKEGNVYKIAKLNDTKMIPDSVKASHILIRVQNPNEAQMAQMLVDSLKTAIESKKITFEQAAKDNSQDGSASQGGDLGWFGKKVMVAPFERAAFHAEKNELVVAQTQFGFHLIKVTEQGKKSKQVQLAILDREVVPSTATYQKIYSEASQMAAKSQNLKGFEQVVTEKNLTKRTASFGENDRSIPGLGTARNLIRAAFFNTDLGEIVVDNDKSPIFELENKFIISALTSIQEEGTRSFESVKPAIQVNVLKDKKRELLLKEFNEAKGATIEQTAAKLGLEVDQASGFSFAYGSVNKIGYEPAINGAAMALAVEQQSNPIGGRNGVYIIKLTELSDKANSDTEAEKQSLISNASFRANYQSYTTLRDNIKIVDKRSKFY
jgi:peptidyl-prolyl cis-trans isomerase D